ncbi:MAG: diaminopimelate epimerase [Thermodesulfovibrionales bacterium]|nr:diaminopimelate epimerase [Thermodesulfovibrionales bacterium]
MAIEFTKMHGLGNDFIVIDSRGIALPDLPGLSKKLCNRRFGVGADQLLVLLESDSADFRMRIFNQDGGEVEMCGNGIRCLAKYIWDRGLSGRETLDIETLAGIIKPEKSGELIRVDMGAPALEAKDIPVNLKGRVTDYPLEVDGRVFDITCVSMGNPHAVIFVDNVSEFPVSYYGPLIESHPLFPKRTNVEFIEVLNPDEIRMRVWERGAGMTMACGTGASASAVASNLKGLTREKVKVLLEAGELFIEWPAGGHVYMTGPAEEVFEGRIEIEN